MDKRWKLAIGYRRLVIKQEGDLGYICEMSDYPRKEQLRDAKLISLSPELLDCLKNFVTQTEGRFLEHSNESNAREWAKELIARAGKAMSRQ